MIFFEDGRVFTFDPAEEQANTEWLKTLGVFGSPKGFNDLAILPRVDISRLESKLSNYKACNTTCDYCLEKHFDEVAPADETSPYAKHAFIRESILKYKPSVVELTGGELFQINNMSALNKMFEFLDEVDPDNKIVMEFITNGKEPLIAKKYFKNPRTYISVSYDPNEGDNYRHITESTVFQTIRELAEIDTSRFLVFWMISSHSDLDSVAPIIEELNALGVRWTIQPINDVTGFFDGNEKYDASFVKELVEKVPTVLEDYSPSRLFLPRISCYDGCVVVKADNKVSRCIFTEAYDEYPEYDEVVDDTNQLTVSAGVSHVCNILNDSDTIKNYSEIERMGYSLIGYNLDKREDRDEKLASIEIIYKYMRDFKKLITSPNPNEHIGYKVAVETSYPQSEMDKQMVVRMMEKVGIKVSDVVDNTGALTDNLWYRFEDGESVDVMLYEDYLVKNSDIDPDKPLLVYTFNNFPCRLLFFGRNVDLQDCLLYNKNNIYPKMLSNANAALSMVIQHIVGEII